MKQTIIFQVLVKMLNIVPEDNWKNHPKVRPICDPNPVLLNSVESRIHTIELLRKNVNIITLFLFRISQRNANRNFFNFVMSFYVF